MRTALLPVVFVVLVVVAGFPGLARGEDPPLSLVDTIAVGGTPDAIVVDHSPLHNDVVFYDRTGQRVRFIDAETLTLSSDFVSLTTSQWEGWLVYNRVHHLVYFISSRGRLTTGGEPWQEVLIHVLENRLKIHEFSLNEPWNPVSGSPQDPFYDIDGVLIKQPFVEGLNARIIVDNTIGGNLDVADLNLDGIDYYHRHRGSYRGPATSPYYYGRGNSIALESNHETAGSDDLLGQDLIYIADANGPAGQVTVMKVQQPQTPLAPEMEAPVDLTSHFLFTNLPQGLDVAGPFDRLWVAPGTQGAVNGALGEVNTMTNTFVGQTPLVYGDQYRLLVDWYDPSRMFVCTFDGWYNDPDQGLYLHLLVNGAVVDSLKLLNDYDEYDGLRGMSFDPYTRRLYLTIGSSIFVVHVEYGPIAPPPEDVFSDGFETGNPGAWSVTVPE